MSCLLQEVHSTEDCEKTWGKDLKDYHIFSHGTGSARGVCTIIPKNMISNLLE